MAVDPDFKWSLRDLIGAGLDIQNNKIVTTGSSVTGALDWNATKLTSASETIAAGKVHIVVYEDGAPVITFLTALDGAETILLVLTSGGAQFTGSVSDVIDDPTDPGTADTTVTVPGATGYHYKYNAADARWYLIGTTGTSAGGSGDITGITTASGSGLTGGTTSGNATLAVDFGTGHTQAARGDAAPNTHAASHGNGQPDAIAIDASQVTSGVFSTSRIPAITSAMIQDGTISGADLAAGAVTGAKIAATTITASNVAAGTLTANEINSATQLSAAQKVNVKVNGTAIGSARDTINVKAGSNVSVSGTDTGSQIEVTVSATTSGAATVTGTPGNVVQISATNTAEDSSVATSDILKRSNLGANVETFLNTPSSANLAAAVTGETGSGALVFGSGPTISGATLIGPALGTPASGDLSNCTNAEVKVNKSGSSPVSEPQIEFIQGTNTTLTVTDVPGSSKVQVQIDTTLAAGSVGATELASNAVTTAKISAGAVDGTKIASGAVDSTHLASNAVTTSAINASAVTLAKLATGSVDSSKIVDGSVTGTDIASATITASNIANSTITATQINASTVLSAAQNHAVQKSGTAVATRPAVNFTDTSSVTFTATDDSVNGRVNVSATASVGAGSVGTTELANGSVTNAKLATDAVTDVKILSGTITAAKLASTTGSGAVVLATSAALVTPNLGVPTVITLTNGTGLPIATGVSGLGTGVATFLATPSSANLRAALTDETGSGAAVFASGPTLTAPVLGVPASGILTNCTGLPIAGIASLGTGVAAALGSAVTGSGAIVLASAPAIDLSAATGTATAAQKVAVKNSGTLVGTRKNLNLIPGSNVTLTVADNAGTDAVDVTINSSGGGGSIVTYDGVFTSTAFSFIGSKVDVMTLSSVAAGTYRVRGMATMGLTGSSSSPSANVYLNSSSSPSASVISITGNGTTSGLPVQVGAFSTGAGASGTFTVTNGTSQTFIIDGYVTLGSSTNLTISLSYSSLGGTGTGTIQAFTYEVLKV